MAIPPSSRPSNFFPVFSGFDFFPILKSHYGKPQTETSQGKPGRKPGVSQKKPKKAQKHHNNTHTHTNAHKRSHTLTNSRTRSHTFSHAHTRACSLVSARTCMRAPLARTRTHTLMSMCEMSHECYRPHLHRVTVMSAPAAGVRTHQGRGREDRAGRQVDVEGESGRRG